MEKKKIGHCGGFEMTKKEVLDTLKNNPLRAKIEKTDAKKFLILQGDTQINGFLWVMQSIVKGYKKSDVVAVAKNMSVFAIA